MQRTLGAVDRDFESQVSLGRYSPYITRVTQIGYKTIPTAFSSVTAAYDIWPDTTAEISLPSAGESWEIVSTSANDTALGSGAQTVTLNALDANYNILSPVTVSLNGTTPVAVPGGAIYFRLNSATIGGTTVTGRRKNAGIITIRQVGTALGRGIIPTAIGGLQQVLYTVPAGYSLEIFSLEVQILSSGGAGTRGADFRLNFRSPTGTTTMPRPFGTTDQRPYELTALTKIRVSEKFDFIGQCVYTSNNNMTVGMAFEAHLYNTAFNT